MTAIGVGLEYEGLEFRRLLSNGDANGLSTTAFRNTLAEFPNQRRLDAAREMLTSRQMTIKDIAQELGYLGTSYFVRSFRRMTGVTPPTEYGRRQSGQCQPLYQESFVFRFIATTMLVSHFPRGERSCIRT